MILTFIILSIVSVITGVIVFNKLSEQKPVSPKDEEPPVLDPPKLPDFPDIIYWELMKCDEIEKKIEEISFMLMVSKFEEPIIQFWTSQLERGIKIFEEKCPKLADI